MKISTLKNRLIVLAAFAMASVAFAQDTSSVYIRNACDSISTMIEFVPAYIEESNWYGNPQTWTKDSTNFMFHETYKTVNVSSSNFKDSLPLSIQAKCRETPYTIYKYASWNNSKQWVEDERDDFATVIYDIHNLKMNGHDSSNTYNILAFIPEAIPEDRSFPSSHLLFSETFEFAFEWWYASASYTHRYKNPEDDSLTIRMRTRYGSSVSNDSLKAVNSAINALSIPDTMKSVRIQVLKVVLIDSRKPLSSSSSEPSSSSSSNPVSCSAEQSSSSSSDVKSSSSEEKSSSSEGKSSSSVVNSSSSSLPVSCSAEESSSSEASSSSEGKSSSSEEKSSSSEGKSSSSEEKSSSSEGKSSSSEASSSSSDKPVSCSAAESSSSDAASSSSDGSVRIFALEGQNTSKFVVQVRRLDGSIVKSGEKLGPGVYYVKYSTGVWQKKSVLSK